MKCLMLASTLVLAVLSGCGTMRDQWGGPRESGKQRVYGGVRRNLEAMKESDANSWNSQEPLVFVMSPARMLAYSLDLPLCAVADTVLLPLALLRNTDSRSTSANPSANGASKESRPPASMDPEPVSLIPPQQ